jgi:hypothetical protein
MKIIHCDLRILNCTVEVRVNQIPVVRLDATHERSQSLPVVEFLTDGQNILEVVVNPGATPSRYLDSSSVAEPKPGARLQASLTEYEEGEFPFRGGRTLVRIEHEATDGTPPKALHLSSGPVPIVSGHRWAWESAAALSLDAPTLESVTRMLRTFHDAFTAHDPAPILDLMHVYYHEYALAYPGRTAEQVMQSVAGSVSRSRPKWEVAPLDPTQFDFRLCAGGRLVQCVDRAWNPLIRADVGKDLPYAFSIMAGLYQGRWLVLR